MMWHNVFSKLRIGLVVLNPKWYVGDRRTNLFDRYQHVLTNVTIAQWHSSEHLIGPEFVKPARTQLGQVLGSFKTARIRFGLR